MLRKPAINEDLDYRQFFEPLSSAVNVFQHFLHAAGLDEPERLFAIGSRLSLF
jgi:hypothetical protein